MLCLYNSTKGQTRFSRSKNELIVEKKQRKNQQKSMHT